METCMLPLGFPSGWVATHCANDFYQQFELKEWDDVHVLWMSETGPSILMTKKPVRKLEDLKGLTLRAIGLQAETLKALGGTPAPSPVVEVYDGIAKGVLDGVYLPIETLKVFKFGEVVDYTTLNWQATVNANFFTVMNKDSWNKLPPDVKEVFDEVSGIFSERYALMWNVVDLEGKAFGLEQGVELIELPPAEAARWQQAVEPVIDNYVKVLEGKGYSEAEARGWIKFLRERAGYWTEKQIEYGIASVTSLK